ncbi:E3 ubiquitin-protein ligase MARCHF2 isoform X1 [Salmo salar]|uniref:E3 ubiquitin-protein ligase MARCHF2 n=1 Tax=Salmo salar TaxID=8030 RepID=A0A1S3LXD1_SALSA|nr:E3 ubiquitin-protein ligase MARCHF2 isoform X1 [Salmo salar]|eukprot:XP_013995269.1 PREDICTED: E3 ubiquitin-protein ligase MARCH2-like isoform X1 [Salmo salar]
MLARPSTSPRLRPKMVAHSPLLSKLWAHRVNVEEEVKMECRQKRKSRHRLSFHFLGILDEFGCYRPCRGNEGMCRICHEGAGGETLLSPCDCTGTLGKVHKSCLEKWLSSSNTSYCELCHTEFTVERRPQPLTQWLRDPGPRSEKRTLLCDMACFLLITPLAAISGWLCLRGAQDHLTLNSRLEAVGLIALTIALFTIYILWTLVSFRYHCQLYSEWRRTNQKVRLLMPDIKGAHSTQHSVPTKSTKKMTDETIV